MGDELIERIYKVFGRVQLVMFRDFSRRKAKSLGICGFVRNESDGSVFILAQGNVNQLAEYEKFLKKGPIFAKVERIEKSDSHRNKKYNSFEIRYE